MPTDPDRRADAPRAARIGPRTLAGLVVAAVLVVAVDPLVEKKPYFEIEHLWGFWAIAGAAACVAAVLVALALRRLVARPEDYYDR